MGFGKDPKTIGNYLILKDYSHRHGTCSCPDMMNMYFMRLVSRAVSVSLGSFGVFCLWASFYTPHFGLEAFLLLSMATAMTLALAPARAK